jgi:hypothetical protein
LTLSVYSAESGGAPLWQEVHPNVQVNAGAFSVLLGSGTALPDNLFDEPDRWIEFTVNGVTLAPRQKFTSVPYALNADKVDGMDGSELGGSLPSGAVVWFADGAAPAGFTRKAGAPGQDLGAWDVLTIYRQQP